MRVEEKAEVHLFYTRKKHKRDKTRPRKIKSAVKRTKQLLSVVPTHAGTAHNTHALNQAHASRFGREILVHIRSALTKFKKPTQKQASYFEVKCVYEKYTHTYNIILFWWWWFWYIHTHILLQITSSSGTLCTPSMTVSVNRDPCPAASAFSACSLVAYLSKGSTYALYSLQKY